MPSFSVVHGRLIDPLNAIDRITDLHVRDGRVAAVGAAPRDFAGAAVVDAAGCLVIPGLVDLAARLREPGQEYKATLRSELHAAVAGGVTSLACLPDTDPPLDEPGLVEMLKHRARQLNLAHVYPLGALTAKLAGERLTEMAELTDAGCVGFSQADVGLVDTQVLYRALQYAATFGFKVWLRPQDPFLSHNGVAHEGEVATRLGLPGIPAAAETIALDAMLRLVRLSGARVHVCRLSTAEAVEMMRRAKHEGLPVTCDVAACHLHLCDVDIGDFNPMMHLVPPLRGRGDRAGLRAGLADGTVDAVCSDHCPVDDDEKHLPFGESAPGASGLELLMPLVLKWGREEGRALSEVVARVTSEPARVLGCDAGHLSQGAPADLCLVDLEEEYTVSPDALKSQGHNTPFSGARLKGRVRATWVSGKRVFPFEA